MRLWIGLFIAFALAATAGGWYWRLGAKPDGAFRTAQVQRGDVVATISATGTLEPEEVIDVGAQVEGMIESFGTDAAGKPIDYRSPVEAGMVLARIDDAVYKADVDTAAAQLEQAKAAVQKGEADLAVANAKLVQAERNWNRAKSMGPSDALSQNDYDMYLADYETAKANVALAQSEIVQAKAGILQAQASLNKAQRNLDFCTIKSPVKGVIIDRRVNIGQTVVSSLNAPSLFLIAKDLTRMQIWVAVNEADVGRIVPGTPVTFTCDAFPERTFEGSVRKARLNATMTQNVVMYTVEVEAENHDNLLLPYLTANVQFEAQKRTNVLTVANAALRWSPATASQVAPDVRSAFTPPDEAESGGGAGQAKSDKHAKRSAAKERHGTIWLKDGQFVRPLEVKLGISDGAITEIAAADLQEGMEVVTGEVTQAAAAAAQKNPFLPTMPRRR